MKILEKKILADVPGTRIIQLNIEAADIASHALPGQFVVVMGGGSGERIPLTIVDNSTGGIRLIFQEAGLTTRLLAQLKAGDNLYALAGPLGRPTEIIGSSRVVLIGGGVGIAEVYPVARALKAAGNKLTVILGARTKELLILAEDLKGLSDRFYVTTDDGSAGAKGLTTDILEELLKKEDYDLAYAVGPIPMMRKVSLIAGRSSLKCVVSLNALMVDGTGMCGCCRVTIGGKTKFTCVDGPEFDAAQVDWEELSHRNSAYQAQEKHICRLENL